MFSFRLLVTSWVILAFISSFDIAGTAFAKHDKVSKTGSMRSLHRAIKAAKVASTILDVDFSNPLSAQRSIDILSQAHTPCWLSQIREVRVKGYPSLGNWTLLEGILVNLDEIETIHWEAWKPISSDVLHRLRRYHDIRLHYTLRFAHDDPYNRSLDPEDDWDPYDNPRDSSYELREKRNHQHEVALKSVVNSTSLYALKANIEYNSDDNFEDLELVFDILSNNPNLRELDLHFNTKGCLLGHSPFAFDFLSHPSARFPPLQVLRLTAYQLDERADGGYVWGYKDFVEDPRTDWNYARDGFPPVPERRADDGRSNLDAWLEIMDWSHLHTFDITYPDLATLDKLRGRVLPLLRHLAVTAESRTHDYGISKSAMSFITETVLPLKSLSIQGFNSAPWGAFLARESWKQNPWRKLKHFAIGNEENTAFIDQQAISAFTKSAIKLKYLDVNIPRPSNTSWDLNKYSFLVSSSTLKHLTLRFPSPDGHFSNVYENDTIREEYRLVEKITNRFTPELDISDPLINITTLLPLFQGLRSRKDGRPLEKLDVHVGNWDKRSSCSMMEPRMRVAFYKCFVRPDGRENCEGKQDRSSGWF